MKSIIVRVSIIFILFAGSFFVQLDRGRTDSSFIRRTGGESKELEATEAMGAMKWYNDQRAYPDGNIPVDWREKALAHTAKNNLAKTVSASAISWTAVGPNNVAGRVRSIAIDPNNTNTVYAGSVSGGIWKSTDGGNTWMPKTDFANNMVIGCIVIDPTNSNTIYAGTGEGYFNYDAFRGIGVLKSTDAGETWTVQNNFIGAGLNYYYYFINKIVIRPDNPNMLFAAVSNQAEGLWKSTDAGASWTRITGGGVTSKFCTDLVMDISSPGTMYASFGLFTADGVYKTTDGGGTWSKLTNGFPAPATKYQRISLAISRSNGNVLFACLSDSNSYTHSIQKTTDGGASWFAVGTPYDNTAAVSGTHLGGQGWYNNVIAVHPTDTNIIYTGGINLFKSTSGGTVWNRITDGYSSPYVHVDQHAIVFDPVTPTTVYFGCDGGVFKTINSGASFTSMNTGLQTAQFYSGAVHPAQNIYYGGTQDNGTLKTTSQPAWSVSLGGDGGATWVDYNTPANIYTEYVYLCLQRSGNSGGSWTKIMTGIPQSGSGPYDGTSDRCAFIAPYVMDPSNPQVLVAGTYKIYRTTLSGASWSAISTDLTGDGTGGSGGTISAIAVAKSSSATIYAGTSGSSTNAARMWVTTNTGTAWTNVTSALPNRYVRAIAVNNRNRDSAYACFSGYGTGHVYSTVNRGTNWANVSGNLPDIPVNAILLDPANNNHILLGTDLGVYETNDGGTNWLQQNTGMANVSVSDLDMNNSGYVFAATHGRGMFKSTNIVGVREEQVDIPADYILAQNYPNPFNPTTNIRFMIHDSRFTTLKVYDVLGQEVTTLVNEVKEPGEYTVNWDASASGGLPSGIYFYRLQLYDSDVSPGGTANQKFAGKNRGESSFTEVKKMLLLK